MNTKTLILAAGLLTGVASAASDVVWDRGVNGTFAPKGGWYAYPEKATTYESATLATLSDKSKLYTLKVTSTRNSSSAGFGFAWAAKNAEVSLAGYKGLCLEYKSTNPVRLALKQNSVEDYNYHGFTLPKKTAVDTLFIPFSSMGQEDWGESTVEVPLDLSAQVGLQIGYNAALATANKSASVQVTLAKVALGNSCSNGAPVLTTAFAGYNNKSLDLTEGDVHEIDLSEVFTDPDEDDLSISVAITSTSATVPVKLLNTESVFTQKDVLKFATTSNPSGSAKVVITAKDPANNKATFTFTFNTVDTENLPVAKDIEFEVLEDSSYKSSLSTNNTKRTICEDADGDATTFVLLTEPEHGKLDIGSTGMITYVPEENYNGKDSFTYKCVETDNTDRESEVGTATITVKNVNDPVEVKIVSKTYLDADEEEHKMGDTLVVDEDFDDFEVSLPKENITITDLDGDDDYSVSGKASGVVKVAVKETADSYVFTISAKADSNGTAKVTFVVSDPGTSKTNVLLYVKVKPVPDAPIAKDDVYDVIQDSAYAITAKKGVLANDLNPDGKASELTVVLDEPPEYGKLELKEDGSFVYESEAGFEGEDLFAYHVVNADGLESDMAVVTLNVLHKNAAPVVLIEAGSKDTTFKEDLVKLSYTKAVYSKWFEDPEGDPMTYSAASLDSLVNVTMASSGVITISPVKDANGMAQVAVYARDTVGGGVTAFIINIDISPVNDRPVAVKKADTVYVPTKEWVVELGLDSLIIDPDGDTLEFHVVSAHANLEATIDSNVLKVTPAFPSTELIKNIYFPVKVSAVDAAGDSITMVIYYSTAEPPKDGFFQMATPKATWQNAILANRGMAAIFDMQGRVMWKQKLPVSESEVRAAASQVQGRKILQVNRQVYTIK